MRLHRRIIAFAWRSAAMMVAIGPLASCQRAPASTEGRSASVLADSTGGEVLFDEMGTDARGIPRYTRREFSSGERKLLRTAFGVDEPEGLYLSDSSDAALVKFDTKAKRCRACYVDSYRVGFLSLRLPRETWEDFEQKMRGKSASDFSPSARTLQRSLDGLDPEARAAFAALIDAGRHAGFGLSIVETYRSPEREALLFALGNGRTHTATSMHSYGRAVDIAVGDGRWERAATRREWVRFRKFVLAHGSGRFHIIGTADRTWDWAHVELESPALGLHSIDEALAFAARCTSDSARTHAPTSAQLGGAAIDPCVVVPALPDDHAGIPHPH